MEPQLSRRHSACDRPIRIIHSEHAIGRRLSSDSFRPWVDSRVFPQPVRPWSSAAPGDRSPLVSPPRLGLCRLRTFQNRTARYAVVASPAFGVAAPGDLGPIADRLRGPLEQCRDGEDAPKAVAYGGSALDRPEWRFDVLKPREHPPTSASMTSPPRSFAHPRKSTRPAICSAKCSAVMLCRSIPIITP